MFSSRNVDDDKNKINNNNNDIDNRIIKSRRSTTFATKLKWSSPLTATLTILLISAIIIPTYGQVQQNTLKVIKEVVCPKGLTCPSPSASTMVMQEGNNPSPSRFQGSSLGTDVKLGDGSYLVNEIFPNTPVGLLLFKFRSPSCVGTISGGQTITCTFASEYVQNKDTDGDGILDGFETDGIPYIGVDGVLRHYKLPNADPLHKNIYVEVDFMSNRAPIGGDGNFGIIQQIRNVFKTAPVSNPDGTVGIKPYIKVNELVPFQTQTDTNGLRQIKSSWFGNATERADPNHVALLVAKAMVFHYAVFANQQPPPNAASSGVSDGRPSMNFLITLGGNWNPLGGSTAEQAGTFLHELGHNLGLAHGGNDEINCKVNYLSVMNYLFQFPILVSNRPLDYSHSALLSLDKNNLNEPSGIGQSSPENLTTMYGPVNSSRGPEEATAGKAIDWNFNGRFNDTGVKSDVNAGFFPEGDSPACGTPGPGGASGTLTGFNDWANIIYITPSLLQTQQQALGIQQAPGISQQQTSPQEREITMNDVRQSRLDLLEEINNAILRVATAPPSARAADIRAVTFDIRNFVAALLSEELRTTSPSPAASVTTTFSAPITTTSLNAIPTTLPSSIHTIASLSQLPVALPPALSQNPAVGGVAGSIDTTHIAQLLKTDQLDSAIGQLNNLLTQVLSSHLPLSLPQQLLQKQGQPPHPQILQPNSINIQPQQLPLQQQQLQRGVLPLLTAGSNSSINANPSPAISNSSSNNNKKNINANASTSVMNPSSPALSHPLQQQRQQYPHYTYPYQSPYIYQNQLPSNPDSARQQLQQQQLQQQQLQQQQLQQQQLQQQQLQQQQLQQQQPLQQLQLPIANAGISQTVLQNSTVLLDGRKSFDPNLGGSIVAYQWTQLPTNGGIPVTLIGGNTATPYFIAPNTPSDNTPLAFSLRVMDNHVGVSANPAVVYVMVKRATTITGTTTGTTTTPALTHAPNMSPGGIITNQQQQLVPKASIPGQQTTGAIPVVPHAPNMSPGGIITNQQQQLVPKASIPGPPSIR